MVSIYLLYLLREQEVISNQGEDSPKIVKWTGGIKQTEGKKMEVSYPTGSIAQSGGNFEKMNKQ